MRGKATLARRTNTKQQKKKIKSIRVGAELVDLRKKKKKNNTLVVDSGLDKGTSSSPLHISHFHFDNKDTELYRQCQDELSTQI